MRSILLITGAVLVFVSLVFLGYEFYIFRQSAIRQLTTLGKIIATNSTAALAFENNEDAHEILSALKAERYIVAACLYNKDGVLFAQYPDNLKINDFPSKPKLAGYHFSNSHLEGFQRVKQDYTYLGTLYLKLDMGVMKERLRLYIIVVVLVYTMSFLLVYKFSGNIQKYISDPIIALAETAKAISDNKDYSVRATKMGDDELGRLTDALNQMLAQIGQQNLALKEFNQNLEQKVSERTRELEEVNKELESFSYSVSHDLRTPLRHISGFADMLANEFQEQLPDKAKHYLKTINNSARKMGALIDDLLQFSRTGRVELKKTLVEMKKVIDDAKLILIPTIGGRNIDWEIEPLPEIYGDHNLLYQVWVNLLDNAIKYTRNKDKTIIKIGYRIEAGEYIFFIQDNGVGFDMHYTQKLFGVFQRMHSSAEFEGTGIGLANVRRIISRHGGRTWADAEVDKGATFYFSLPYHDEIVI